MDVTQTTYREPDPSLVTTTHVTYALHAAGLAIGAFGASTVIGAFVFGWPSIIAVIINYVKRGDVQGTWLETHFRWQIRTFWFGLLSVVLCGLFVLATLGLGLIFVWFPLGLVTIWFIYRVVRGWLALSNGRPMYVSL